MNILAFYRTHYEAKFLVFDPNVPKQTGLPKAFITLNHLSLVLNKGKTGISGDKYIGHMYEIFLFNLADIGTFAQPAQVDPIDFECHMTEELVKLYPFWKQDIDTLLDFALTTDPCFSRQGISFIRIDKSDFRAFKERVKNHSLDKFPVHGVLQYQDNFWRMELPSTLRPAPRQPDPLGYADCREEDDEAEEEDYEAMPQLKDYLLSHNPMPVCPLESTAVKNQVDMTESGMVFNAIGTSFAIAFLTKRI